MQMMHSRLSRRSLLTVTGSTVAGAAVIHAPMVAAASSSDRVFAAIERKQGEIAERSRSAPSLAPTIGTPPRSCDALAQVSEFPGEFTATHKLPILKIAIGAEPVGNASNGVALVDTGSFASVLDQSFVQQLSLGQVGTQESLTSDGFRSDPAYGCRIILPDRKIFRMELAVQPLRSRFVDAILGMDVLRFYEIRIRAKDGLVTFNWAGD